MEQIEPLQNLIYIIRGRRVMLDYDLARIYQVETRVLNQAVKRNPKRFEGEEFMFRLSKDELNKCFQEEPKNFTNLKSQNVISSWGGNRKMPYAFTEIGVSMLSSVLRSEVAIQANRKIMKAFIAYRHLAELPIAATYLDLRKQIEDIRLEMNNILADQNDINENICAQLDAISIALAELQSSEDPNDSTNQYHPIGFIRPAGKEDGN